MPAGVTTLYFEAEHEDDLRRVGYWQGEEGRSPGHRGPAGRPPRVPLQVGCWEGNRVETSTIIPVVEAFQAAHGIAELARRQRAPECCRYRT